MNTTVPTLWENQSDDLLENQPTNERGMAPFQGWGSVLLDVFPGRCPGLASCCSVGAGAFQRVPKYAYRATREEIRDNDFNLNILRYVDTFEAEHEVDLKAVEADIARLEGELAGVRKEMAGYLKELNLA